jgi:hypothetical protein
MQSASSSKPIHRSLVMSLISSSAARCSGELAEAFGRARVFSTETLPFSFSMMIGDQVARCPCHISAEVECFTSPGCRGAEESCLCANGTARLLIQFVRSTRDNRQLQHCRPLTFAQSVNQHDLPVGKLERIVMGRRLVLIDF